jgi:alpha-L-rhamnosidase
MKPSLPLLTALLVAPLAAHALQPTALRTEFIENPLGLDTAKPRFSWIVEDPAEGAKQTAYQVQASSSEDELIKGEADLWDSGKISSDQSHLVEYAGKPLTSRQQVWWRVKSWDQAGKETSWSQPARFELALLEDKDWTAPWVRAELPPENNDAAKAWMSMATVPVIQTNLMMPAKDAANPVPAETLEKAEASNLALFEKLTPCPLLRGEVELKGTIRQARAYVAAPGFFELHVNGTKVGDRELEPGVTPFKKQVLYSVHDITPFLREGPNALGLILGHGWFNSDAAAHCQPSGKEPVARAQFEFEFADGRRLVASADGEWRYASSAILKDSHWIGECYDARHEQAGWDQPGFNAGEWKTCLVTESPTKRLAPDLAPPERVVRKVKAKRLYSPLEGVWIYDMGEAFSGTAELSVNVPAGTMLTLRYAQRLWSADQTIGSVLRYPSKNLRKRLDGMIAPSFGSMGGGGGVAGWKYQSFTPTDVYAARGGERETWRRRFGYTAFRYVELTGYPGKPPEDAVTGVVVHTDLPREGGFTSSDDLLNRIYAASVNSLLNCTHGFIQDNPTREKQFTSWAPAATAGLAAGFALPQLPHLWTKVIDSSVFTQDASGHFDPFFGFRENYECPVTESGAIPLAYELWLRHGDDRPLLRSLDGFAAYFDYYLNNPQNRRDPGLHPSCATAAPDLSQDRLRGGNYSFDWYDDDTVVDLPSGQLPPREKRKLMWGTGILCEDLVDFLSMAKHAGRSDLTEKYGPLLENVRTEMRQQLFQPAAGSYGCQGSNALALTAGVAAPEDRARVLSAIVDDATKRGGRFTTGTHGFPRLLAVLSENGHADLAFQLVTREGYPGLANLLAIGNGTFGETWNTWLTPYGSVGGMVQSERGTMGSWFTEWLGGIRPDPAHTGFRQVILGPVFPGKLESARVEVPSLYGKIQSAWKREGDTVRWNVTVPWNTRATVKLPGSQKITVNGKSEDRSEFELPAGKWEITAQPPRTSGEPENL